MRGQDKQDAFLVHRPCETGAKAFVDEEFSAQERLGRAARGRYGEGDFRRTKAARWLSSIERLRRFPRGAGVPCSPQALTASGAIVAFVFAPLGAAIGRNRWSSTSCFLFADLRPDKTAFDSSTFSENCNRLQTRKSFCLRRRQVPSTEKCSAFKSPITSSRVSQLFSSLLALRPTQCHGVAKAVRRVYVECDLHHAVRSQIVNALYLNSR